MLDGDEDPVDLLREQFRSLEREAATEDGVIVPVDCIPVRLPPGKRDFFGK